MQVWIPSLRRFLSSHAFIVISVVLSILAGLGSTPLFDLDEGAFTEATREMIASGNYAATYLDGEPRYDKPIFFYWLQSLSIHSFGFNEWAFRLPSALAAMAWCLAVFYFVKEFYGTYKAKIAALFLVNCLWIALISRSAIADALLNLFLCLAMFDIWRYLQNPSRFVLLRVYAWMALGLLTKGPIAVVVPLVVSCLYLLSTRQIKASFKVYIYPYGWLLFIAIVSPWIVAVYLDQGSGFFKGFIIEHNMQRFSHTREDHGGSLLYYVFVLPLILLPFSGLLLKPIRAIPTLWGNPLTRYLGIWFFFIFLVFSFSKTQLPHYILNGCVPLLLIMATHFPAINKARWSVIIPIVVTGILIALPELLAISATTARPFDGAQLENTSSALPPHYRIYALILLTFILLVSLLPKIATWQRLAIIGLAMNTFIFLVLVKVIWNVQQRPLHSAMHFLNDNNIQQDIVAYKIHMPTFSLYRKRITLLRPPQRGDIILTRIDRLPGLTQAFENTEIKVLFEEGGIQLVQIAGESK